MIFYFETITAIIQNQVSHLCLPHLMFSSYGKFGFMFQTLEDAKNRWVCEK